MLTRRSFVVASTGGFATAAIGAPAMALAQGVEAAQPARIPPVVKIGLLMPYSGQFADPAAQMDSGIKLYMKQHGDLVAGKKIELIRKDTGGAPDIAKRLGQELIVNEQIDILAGFVITPEALAVADLSAKAKKFMVVMNAATSIITTASPYITRTSYTLAQDCEPLARWAYSNGSRRVYTMVSDYAPGHEAEAAFQQAFKAAGGEIIGYVRTPLLNPDFSPFVQRAKDAKPDGVFIFVPGGAQPVALAKTFIERDMKPTKVKIMGVGTLTEEVPLHSMGDAAIGIITAYHYDYTHKSIENAAFVQAYNSEFGRNPDNVSVGGYDGMHVIYEALKRTDGNTDGERLIAAAKGMKWKSPRGAIAIDAETRDIINTIYIRRVERVGGQVENVEIEKYENVKDPVAVR